MALLVTLTPPKTYKTRENAEKAVADIPSVVNGRPIRYIIMQTEEGRFYPVFLGEVAVQYGLHFRFCVLG